MDFPSQRLNTRIAPIRALENGVFGMGLNIREPSRRSESQNGSFNPSWICREVVEVEVITPMVRAGIAEAEVNTTALAVRKFA